MVERDKEEEELGCFMMIFLVLAFLFLMPSIIYMRLFYHLEDMEQAFKIAFDSSIAWVSSAVFWMAVNFGLIQISKVRQAKSFFTILFVTSACIGLFSLPGVPENYRAYKNDKAAFEYHKLHPEESTESNIEYFKERGWMAE